MGSGRVAIVTDSTAYLPDDVVAALGVLVVPLQVVIDGRPGDEGVDVSPREVAAALSARGRPGVTTSRPSPHRLGEAYRAAGADRDTGAVVAVHLSRHLSGTYDAALLAARDCAGLDVRVVDSRAVAMGLGFAVIAAGEAAQRGADLDAVVQSARRVAARSRCLFVVDDLDMLRRSGRLGTTRALVGAALGVKPLLELVEGRITVLETVRSSGRAHDRLLDLAVSTAGDAPVDAAVHHLAAPERAAALAAALRARLPRLGACHVTQIGAAVGAHVGPGCVGVVISPH